MMMKETYKMYMCDVCVCVYARMHLCMNMYKYIRLPFVCVRANVRECLSMCVCHSRESCMHAFGG
jgi:hypothetical protein